MSIPAHVVASHASFQALANCYLREVNSGNWYSALGWQQSSEVTVGEHESHVVELELKAQRRLLAIGISYRSLVGRHTLTCAYERAVNSQTWKPIDPLSAQLLLVDDVYAQAPDSSERLELIGRVIESHQAMTAYLNQSAANGCSQNGAAASDVGFINSEQSVVFGHWLHPTPKSRQGITTWQHEHYAPELGGRFQLHFFAAARELVEQHSLSSASAEEISGRIARHGRQNRIQRRLIAELGDQYCLIPVHPLQAQWLLHQRYVLDLLDQERLVDLGRLGSTFTPTSSVRTLYCETLDFMVKVCLPVKITNSLRINLKSELGDSVWISKLLRECDARNKFPTLRVIEDPAYITVSLPDREETGFETIFRDNPFRRVTESPAAHVQSVAALVQDRLPGQIASQLGRIVRTIAEQEAVSVQEASHRWFDAYWRCSIAPTLCLYDEFGISLEAHQQNVLLEFDHSGYPRLCHYRDIQGLALAEGAREQLLRLVPELAQQPKVFEANDIVRNGFGYYVFFNQLYSVINRMGLDDLVSEAELLEVLKGKLIELRRGMERFGGAFIDVLLREPAIPCKANLLTRIADVDELQAENELGVYTMVNNPLCALTESSDETLVSRVLAFR